MYNRQLGILWQKRFYMKQIQHSLLFVIVLYFVSMTASAQSFIVDNLRYEVISTAEKEVVCNGLSTSDNYVNIPNTIEHDGTEYKVTKIAANAFKNSRIRSIGHLPDELKEIGDYAFYYCEYANTSVTIPKTVEKIGKFAFYGSDHISLTLPENSALVSLGSGAFEESGMWSAVIPAAFTEIPSGMFRSCKNLRGVKIPSTVTAIGLTAFYECTSLESIELPDGIETIGGYAFAKTGISSIKLPAKLKEISGGAFAYCSKLNRIESQSLTAPLITESTMWATKQLCMTTREDADPYKRVRLVIPKGSLGYDGDIWCKFKTTGEAVLSDDNGNIKQDTYATNDIRYSRDNMTSGSYATFCLPFDTNLSDVSEAFENVYTANQTALYKPDGKLILLLQKIDKNASIPAGQAFVAKLKNNVTSVTFSNNKLMTVDTDIMQNREPAPLHVFDWDGTSGLLTENTDIKVSYGGTLANMTDVGSEYETFNSNGTFGPTKNGQVKAFRAYVLKQNAAAQTRVKSISFGLEDNNNTTNIETVVDLQVINQDKNIYGIDGRLVDKTGKISNLPSGVYIQNHRKFYVK